MSLSYRWGSRCRQRLDCPRPWSWLVAELGPHCGLKQQLFACPHLFLESVQYRMLLSVPRCPVHPSRVSSVQRSVQAHCYVRHNPVSSYLLTTLCLHSHLERVGLRPPGVLGRPGRRVTHSSSAAVVYLGLKVESTVENCTVVSN